MTLAQRSNGVQGFLVVALVLLAPEGSDADVDASAIILKDFPQKCLDLKGGDTTNGNTLQIWDCNKAQTQGWIFKGEYLVYKQDQTKCVDLKDGDDTNGKTIQIWDCGEEYHNQAWTYESGALGIRHTGSKGRKCIDLRGGITTNGNEVQIWDCNDSKAQMWVLGTEDLSDFEQSSTPYVIIIVVFAVALVVSISMNLCMYLRQSRQGASKNELPSGWEKTWSDQHNRSYYFNRNSGEVTWEKPTGPPPPGKVQAPEIEKASFTNPSPTSFGHPASV